LVRNTVTGDWPLRRNSRNWEWRLTGVSFVVNTSEKLIRF
jgi:hypothetical protein